ANRPPDTKEKWQWPSTRIWLWLLGLLALNYFLGRYFFPGPEAAVKIPYTLFKEQVQAGNVVEIFSTGLSVTGRFDEPVVISPSQRQKGDSINILGQEKKSVEATNFTTELPAFLDPGLESLLIEKGVVIRAQPLDDGGNPLFSFLILFGP